MRRRLTTRHLIALMLLAAGGCRSNDEPVLIGHLDPAGEAGGEVRGIRLALDAVNAESGRPAVVQHGRVGEADWPTQAVRLTAVNDVKALIGAAARDKASLLAKAGSREKTVTLCLAGTAGGPADRFAYAVGLSPAGRGDALGRFAAEHSGAVAAVVARDDTAEDAVRAFRSAREKGELSVLYINADSKDLPTSINGHGGTVLIAGPAGWVAAARKAAPEAQILYAGPATPGLPGATIVTAAYFPGDTAERSKAFTEAYRKQHNEDPTEAAALAHDAVTVYAAAVRADSAEADKVIEQLDGGSYDVLAGRLTFERRRAVRPGLVGRITAGGQVTFLARYPPHR